MVGTEGARSPAIGRVCGHSVDLSATVEDGRRLPACFRFCVLVVKHYLSAWRVRLAGCLAIGLCRLSDFGQPQAADGPVFTESTQSRRAFRDRLYSGNCWQNAPEAIVTRSCLRDHALIEG